jgi:hypothetical protein
MRNLSNDLEVHRRMISKGRDAVKLPSNALLSGARDDSCTPTLLQANHSR